MILLVDIGNTTISVSVHKKMRSLAQFKIDQDLSVADLKKRLKRQVQLIAKKHKSIELCLICSVVPKRTVLVDQCVRSVIGISPLIIGKDLKVPIKNKYRKPSQVGQDRLVGAYAAKEQYGAPLIIVDFGTAITFDVISKNGHYEGGVIVPGIHLSAESLFQKTAMLPRIDTIKLPRNLIGRDTKESILSGIFNGYGEMCSGLITNIARKISGNPQVIITGGHTQLMKRFISCKVHKIDNDLVFKGMVYLAQNA